MLASSSNFFSICMEYFSFFQKKLLSTQFILLNLSLRHLYCGDFYILKSDIKKFSYISETRNVLIYLVTCIFIDPLDLGQCICSF